MRTSYLRDALTMALAIVSTSILVSIPASAATTQCTCPKVPASGVGNSSCSASESNGKCTVDFNIFAEREARAAALLRRADVQLYVPDPNRDAIIGLAELKSQPNKLVDAIIIYLAVALSAQPNANDLTEVVRTIATTVRSPVISSRLDTAFDPSAGFGLARSDNPPLENFGGIKGRIVQGCIELFIGDTWVMFKTSWSPYASTPRCGG